MKKIVYCIFPPLLFNTVHIFWNTWAIIEHTLYSHLYVYIYYCSFFFTWDGITREGRYATACSISAVITFPRKKEVAVWSKTNTTVLTTANLVPHIIMKNHNYAYLRNVCTCITHLVFCNFANVWPWTVLVKVLFCHLHSYLIALTSVNWSWNRTRTK